MPFIGDWNSKVTGAYPGGGAFGGPRPKSQKGKEKKREKKKKRRKGKGKKEDKKIKRDREVNQHDERGARCA